MRWLSVGAEMACFVDSGSRVRGNDVAIAGMTWVWRDDVGWRGNDVTWRGMAGEWRALWILVPASAGMTWVGAG